MIRIISLRVLAALSLLTLYAATTAALAQTPTATPVNHIVLGDIAASIIQWTIAAFGPSISAVVLWLVVRMLKTAGLKNTDLLKDQLQRIVVNGINAGAAKAQQDLRGRAVIDIKSTTAQYALWYAQTHGADIIKALGLDPGDGEAVDAIKARIETALADPKSPTNPVASLTTNVSLSGSRSTTPVPTR